jgi:hypothetical protein
MPRSTLDPTDRSILEGKNYAHVSTLRDDGTIQTVPVWVDVDEDSVVLNRQLSRPHVRGDARDLQDRPRARLPQPLNDEGPLRPERGPSPLRTGGCGS